MDDRSDQIARLAVQIAAHCTSTDYDWLHRQLEATPTATAVIRGAANYFSKHPDALPVVPTTAGAPTQFLLHHLIKEGIEGVSLSPCPHCGRRLPLPRRLPVDELKQRFERVCTRCFGAQSVEQPSDFARTELAERLGRLIEARLGLDSTGWVFDRLMELPIRHAALRTTDRLLRADEAILPTVPAQIDANVQFVFQGLRRAGLTSVRLPECPGCGRQMPLPARVDDGNGSRRVCRRCKESTNRVACSDCHRLRNRYRVVRGQPLCRACSQSSPAKRPCQRCSRSASLRDHDGKALCLNCVPKSLHECSFCGEVRTRARIIGRSGACGRCYQRITTVPSMCPSCAQTRIVAYASPLHPAVCASCSGDAPRYCCQVCGTEGRRFGGLCARCTILNEAAPFADASHDGWISFYRTLAESNAVDSHVRWLQGRIVSESLRALQKDLSQAEDVLGQIGSRRTRRNLEARLVAAGIISSSEAARWVLQYETDRVSDGLDQSTRLLLLQFLRWHVGRRVSQSLKRGYSARRVLPGASVELKAAARFLRYIQLLPEGIDALSDRATWIAYQHANSGTGRSLRAFGTWWFGSASRNPLALARTSTHAPTADASLHHDALRRVVRSTTLPTDVKCVVIVACIFGVALEKCCELKGDQVEVCPDESVALKINGLPVTIPPPFDAAFKAHMTITRSADDFLFPGRIAGTAVSAAKVTAHLRNLIGGISLASLRRAGLQQLVLAAPAGVVASVTGYTPAHISRLAARLAQPWMDYPRLRMSDAVIDHPRRETMRG